MGEKDSMKVSRQKEKGEPSETAETRNAEQRRHGERNCYCKLSYSLV